MHGRKEGLGSLGARGYGFHALIGLFTLPRNAPGRPWPVGYLFDQTLSLHMDRLRCTFQKLKKVAEWLGGTKGTRGDRDKRDFFFPWGQERDNSQKDSCNTCKLSRELIFYTPQLCKAISSSYKLGFTQVDALRTPTRAELREYGLGFSKFQVWFS